MWRVRPAGAADLPAIEDLVVAVDGDREDLREAQFVVAEDENGAVLGCGRLIPYPGFCELASLGVRDGQRARGVGREIVTGLIDRYQGPIYLVCEDHVVDFFRQFGFDPTTPADPPAELGPKLQRCHAPAVHINVMCRDFPKERAAL